MFTKYANAPELRQLFRIFSGHIARYDPDFNILIVKSCHKTKSGPNNRHTKKLLSSPHCVVKMSPMKLKIFPFFGIFANIVHCLRAILTKKRITFYLHRAHFCNTDELEKICYYGTIACSNATIPLVHVI